MELPNAQFALVGRAKLTEYLLNPAHPENGGKAAFFASLGFQRDGWAVLAAALRQMALELPVAKSMETAHGDKYVLDGALAGPSGKAQHVRTIWIIDRGSEAPRFVTAYPGAPMTQI